MSHVFKLSSDLKQLSNCGYLNASTENELQRELTTFGVISVKLDAVYTQAQKEQIVTQFKELLSQYNLSEYYDTLMFVCCVESNHADQQFQHAFQSYEHKLRDKQLAQLLVMFNPAAKHLPLNIKVSSVIDTVKVTKKKLL